MIPIERKIIKFSCPFEFYKLAGEWFLRQRCHLIRLKRVTPSLVKLYIFVCIVITAQIYKKRVQKLQKTQHNLSDLIEIKTLALNKHLKKTLQLQHSQNVFGQAFGTLRSVISGEVSHPTHTQPPLRWTLSSEPLWSSGNPRTLSPYPSLFWSL